ncbi:CATRA conflict system CASPASE/TPR repeat-associated protein [Streptomyces sp. NPDC058417]|uniref:CATRA conflict system CASPASE/TPR repeat-associated protein n=2 Tax=Streptomyces TaxID=1883 RepID=UPI00365EF7C6
MTGPHGPSRPGPSGRPGPLAQHLVVHLYAPADGPSAPAAHRALQAIWHGCRVLFGMTGPIPRTGLPPFPPERLDAPAAPGTEAPLAAQERPGTDLQAILRRHHDVLDLSVCLASDADGRGGAEPGERWRSPNRAWSALTDPHAPHLLGQARLYVARVASAEEVRTVADPLYERLRRLLPAEAVPADPWRRRGSGHRGDLALWETGDDSDARALRRFLVAVAPDADAAASAWLWSGGGTALPPFARYLLHAAKLRYQLRVWERDNHTRELRAALESLGAQLRRLGADGPATADLLRLRRLDSVLFLNDLRALRRTVDIAAENLTRSVDLGELLRPGTAFADDAALARSFGERLDDDLAYLGLAVDGATELTAAHPAAAPALPPPAAAVTPQPPTSETQLANATEAPELNPDHARNVFVVHGRDLPARDALFAFLRALGLRPLEWEDLVALTGRTSPFLGEVLARAMPYTRAVVVLLTPEDVVRLHPDLHEPHGREREAAWGLQARPNVLLELGMALVTHPDRTLLLLAGDQRPPSDLGGRNFVRLSGEPGFRTKVASRLRLAGCPVDTTGQDWLTAGDFGSLDAYDRRPPGTEDPPATPGPPPGTAPEADGKRGEAGGSTGKHGPVVPEAGAGVSSDHERLTP